MILLRLYGVKAQRILDEVGVLRSVIILDYIAPAEMQYVDICVASLLPAWNHVCVPSKVVSAICYGLPVLYNANEESEGACMFPDAIWLLPDTGNMPEMVFVFLDRLSVEEIIVKRKAAWRYSQELLSMEHNNQSNLLKQICE